MTSESAIATALANPDVATLELDRLDAEESLHAYIKQGWHILEPGREFKDGRVIEEICVYLEAVTRGEIKRLLVNVPPGFMKSLLFNVFWPTWEWGPKSLAHMRYVHASYSEHLTIRDNVKARRLIRSEWYQQRWGHCFQIMADEDAKYKFTNSQTGFKLATSVGGVGTGERGDRGILDDPHKVGQAESIAKREEAILWFAEEWPTRINDPEKSVQLCIMQRVHERDVSGEIIAGNLGYEHLCLPMEYEVQRKCYTSLKPTWYEGPKISFARLPSGETVTEDEYTDKNSYLEDERRFAVDRAYEDEPIDGPGWQMGYPADWRTEDKELLWPERFSRDHIERELKPQMRLVGGTYAEAGQLQQRPTARGGGMFKRDDFRYIDQGDYQRLLIKSKSVRGWDLAGSENKDSPYTASVKGRRIGHTIYVEDYFRFRGSPGKVDRRIVLTAEADGISVQQDLPQDPGQAGKAQKEHFAKMLHGFDFRVTVESGSKEDRARPLASQNENGNLVLVRGPWNREFVDEMSTFPRGRYKDVTDAASRMYYALLKGRRRKVGAGMQVSEGAA